MAGNFYYAKEARFVAADLPSWPGESMGGGATLKQWQSDKKRALVSSSRPVKLYRTVRKPVTVVCVTEGKGWKT